MIFDSDVLIRAFRGNVQSARVITEAPDRALSILSLMELLRGARSKAAARQIRRSLRQLEFRTLPLSESIGALPLTIIEDHALAHGIEMADALIAASAIEAGLPLCTANVKHFRAIEELVHVAFRAPVTKPS